MSLIIVVNRIEEDPPILMNFTGQNRETSMMHVILRFPTSCTSVKASRKSGDIDDACHSEGSEESAPRRTQILRCPQNDTAWAAQMTDFER